MAYDAIIFDNDGVLVEPVTLDLLTAAARDRTASEAQIQSMRRGEKDTYADVDALAAIDAPRGIVSTNQQATIDSILEYHDLGALFETAYGREPTVESLRRKKPAPYYLERALDDLDAEAALFVGDSKSDVEAAHRAGVDSAFIRREHRAETVLGTEPTYELDSLWDLHEVGGVPLAPDGPARSGLSTDEDA
ncbi:HAD family hydrolase [Halobellus sp. Atlit-38R]|uniref:HAD family hydrolase n=1 Tax=Halobellus sp. Atlit-38R TaxID=2282131 RepID=UPI000EF25694|nr:HAD-IA family hydrolase [Halobellus sp. Atlit-38R]RLM88139.1 HAD family hydrolase [Halobellus sp. Atlit-38R]